MTCKFRLRRRLFSGCFPCSSLWYHGFLSTWVEITTASSFVNNFNTLESCLKPAPEVSIPYKLFYTIIHTKLLPKVVMRLRYEDPFLLFVFVALSSLHPNTMCPPWQSQWLCTGRKMIGWLILLTYELCYYSCRTNCMTSISPSGIIWISFGPWTPQQEFIKTSSKKWGHASIRVN